MTSDPTPPLRSLRLSPADYPFYRPGCHPITIVYYFEQRQNAGKLRAALAPTLQRFFPLKGRLSHDAEARPSIEEDLSSGLGAAVFEECAIDEVPDLQNHVGMLRFASPVDTRLQAPLLRLRLIQLPCGSWLSASISHAVADGFGYFFFLMSWAAAARGAALPDPSHNRAALNFGRTPIDALSDATPINIRVRSWSIPHASMRT
jgi:hypothetical protein